MPTYSSNKFADEPAPRRGQRHVAPVAQCREQVGCFLLAVAKIFRPCISVCKEWVGRRPVFDVCHVVSIFALRKVRNANIEIICLTAKYLRLNLLIFTSIRYKTYLLANILNNHGRDIILKIAPLRRNRVLSREKAYLVDFYTKTFFPERADIINYVPTRGRFHYL